MPASRARVEPGGSARFEMTTAIGGVERAAGDRVDDRLQVADPRPEMRTPSRRFTARRA